ncbi:helix-turn-helix transcriptional regulator [Mesorhizobium sp. CAU 1732]|uniref:helix-turn-helix transcriptional regulator n=1 Tax=Mesorhizobium sp. CAU 1732 TaxID=3140358 RepID=UPI00326038B0
MRHAKRLSQEELAHRARVHRTYVSSLERSQYSPTIDTWPASPKSCGRCIRSVLSGLNSTCGRAAIRAS